MYLLLLSYGFVFEDYWIGRARGYRCEEYLFMLILIILCGVDHDVIIEHDLSSEMFQFGMAGCCFQIHGDRSGLFACP